MPARRAPRPTYIRLGNGAHGITAYTPPPTTPPAPAPGRRAGKVERVAAHPLAWAHALQLAGGDARRLTINRDGSVTVNNPAV
jgi:hypothetical protein